MHAKIYKILLRKWVQSRVGAIPLESILNIKEIRSLIKLFLIL